MLQTCKGSSSFVKAGAQDAMSLYRVEQNVHCLFAEFWRLRKVLW